MYKVMQRVGEFEEVYVGELHIRNVRKRKRKKQS